MYKSVVCFDLDDTLYKEVDFVRSAFQEISSWSGHPEMINQMMDWFHQEKNVFQELNSALGLDIGVSDYLEIYRRHYPSISLSDEAIKTLDLLSANGVVLGLITDGRSVTQRNKVSALGLDRWFQKDNIIISGEFGSEKTDTRNFSFFMEKYLMAGYTYVGDNPQKDFIIPNRLGWRTVMLQDDGRNIHKPIPVTEDFSPKFIINKLSSLLDIINN